ncbi:MAG TPA: ornithine carbamoyltransferase [Microthrixaceae bacterium]|nr:ornithine carbamoyltransferase [Microthrixaceae bacterium]
MRHFLEITDLSLTEIDRVLELSELRDPPQILMGTGGVLAFEKQSARTRISMEMAVSQLGGHPVTVRDAEVGFDTRESVEDLGRLFSGFGAFIGARVYEHSKLERLASVATVPVLNLLSDESHPIQILADLLTIRQAFGTTDDLTIAWVGDANNVARSLVLAAHLCGCRIRVAHPDGFGFTAKTSADLARAGCAPLITADPRAAVAGADVVYTDAWYSMGQEDERDERRRTFGAYQVDDALMADAADHAIFLHCLPAHRGDEVTDGVLDGPRSRIWQQAENRMHSARGLLLFMLEGEGLQGGDRA